MQIIIIIIITFACVLWIIFIKLLFLTLEKAVDWRTEKYF